MELLPRFLQYGEEISFPSRASIYAPGAPIGARPIFYVIAGLLKIEYPVRDSTFALWLHPDRLPSGTLWFAPVGFMALRAVEVKGGISSRRCSPKLAQEITSE